MLKKFYIFLNMAEVNYWKIKTENSYTCSIKCQVNIGAKKGFLMQIWPQKITKYIEICITLLKYY